VYYISNNRGIKQEKCDLNETNAVMHIELIKFCRVYVKEYIEDNGLSKNFN